MQEVFNSDGCHSRGYLPHFDGGEISQFITFRLADSLPQRFLDRWREELKEETDDIDAALRRRIEIYLDRGFGACYLKDERIANVVQNAFLFFDGERYRLSAWVVMPNHVHLLLTPLPNHTLAKIMQSLKSFTASKANKILNRAGHFWQQESFDRFVRDADHFAKVISYIESNPVKAKLCNKAGDWQFSSAKFRFSDSAT